MEKKFELTDNFVISSFGIKVFQICTKRTDLNNEVRITKPRNSYV